MIPREHPALTAKVGATGAALPASARVLKFRASAPTGIPAFADSRASAASAILKRILDFVVASAMIFVLAPLMAAIALLIRIETPGPALFRQHRVGLGGRSFLIVKFRSMTVLEDGNDVVQARKNDERVTRTGTWLRRTSLDELPQLFNVLRGEMSLVGPRPHAVCHDRYYAPIVEGYALRSRVRPGITGWAQIHGLRGGTPTLEAMAARVRYDVWYVRHASIALDLQILLRTPYAMFSRRNAY